MSANLIQMWLTQFDRGELINEEAAAAVAADYEAKIAALERGIGQLTMKFDLVKKKPRLHLVRDNENYSIISGPRPVPSDGGHVIDLPRSTFYYQANEPAVALSDLQVVQLIESI